MAPREFVVVVGGTLGGDPPPVLQEIQGDSGRTRTIFWRCRSCGRPGVRNHGGDCVECVAAARALLSGRRSLFDRIVRKIRRSAVLFKGYGGGR